MSSNEYCNTIDRQLTTFPSHSTVSISTNESNQFENETNDKQSSLRKLIRHVMRTFYDMPMSLVVEYIYHYECINLKDLASLLHMNEKHVHSYIQQFKRDLFIKEEIRRQSNESSKKKFDPQELYYTIDIVTFVNVVKYRLINMKLTIEKCQQEQVQQEINYKCEQCLKEYSEWDIAALFKDSTSDEFTCTSCDGVINDNNNKEQETKKWDLRLFNEQLTELFQILENIDKIMKNECLAMNSSNTQITIRLDEHDVSDTNSNSRDSRSTSEDRIKSIPEWFTRSTFDPKSDQTN